MKHALHALRHCLEGAIPSALATCAADGTPNVTFVSQVDYVDARHVAMSFQFFNKTRDNILAHPYATVYLTDPGTAQAWRLSVRYLRTETEGPLFQRMRARLAGIASHTGMAGVFRLLGADIYEVQAIEAVPGKLLPAPPAPCNVLSGLRQSSERLAACTHLQQLLDEALACLRDHFGIRHAMLLMMDARRGQLYTVASCGYPESGVGSEIALGEGVIGVAAQHRTPIRVGHANNEYAYGRAVRAAAIASGMANALRDEIPLPGLAAPNSQLAAPLLAGGEVLGVLYVEGPEMFRFSYDDEDALMALASQMAIALRALGGCPDDETDTPSPSQPGKVSLPGPSLTLRRFGPNDVIFIGEDYLIKGVAGAIFWRLLDHFEQTGRVDFSNRELRLDPALRLPDIDDNLEARLILLSRRLAERCPAIAIEKTGRGRFRLRLAARIQRQDATH